MDIEQNYLELLGRVINQGNKKSDRTGTGTLSLFGEMLVHNMEDGFPLLTSKKMSFKTIVKELLWILRGQTNIHPMVQEGCYIWVGDAYKNYISLAGRVEEPDYDIHVDDIIKGEVRVMTQEEFIKRIIDDAEFAEVYGELGPIYGEQWIGMGQIDSINNQLRNNPNSRRMLLSSWNVEQLDDMVLPPCHFAHQVYVHDGKIDLMWYQRSADLCLGLPFNIAFYALLLMLYAKEHGLKASTLKCVIGDAHIYNNHIDGALEQIGRSNLPELPTVTLHEDISFSNLFLEGFTINNYKHLGEIKYPLSC